MDAERFRKVEDLFHELVELPAEVQRNRLTMLCQGDAALEREVLKLLTHSENGADQVDRVLSDATQTLSDGSGSLEGAVVGPYQITAKLGEGGMGEVYAATQTEPIERDVALKVIRADRVSSRMLARFRAELSTLSLMQHDAIAQIYDAGEMPDGRPFFVMERVSGAPLIEFCDQEHLGLTSRLSIFLTVCSAVQHAHQRGVIHRDLKPSNILVSRQDDRFVVKVIDFGIAKAISTEPGPSTQQTVVGQVLGSPDYMSPEQANSQGTDVDIRADVYALGAVLYELLTGCTPLRLNSGDGQLRLLQAIVEASPERPSARLRERATADSEQRAGALRGDLDWIVLKALAKERSERYETVAAFAAEIERHLRNEPVSAHPPGALYQAGKFARRHPTGVAVSVVSVVLLLGGFVGTLWGLRAAQQAESLAEIRAASSEQAVNYLLDMFSNANPEFHQGERVTVEALIAAAAADSNEMFAQEPGRRIEMQYRLAEVMSRMGNFDGAIELANQALAADQQSLNFPSPATTQGVETLIRTYLSQSRFREALVLMDQLEGLVGQLPPAMQPIIRAKLTFARATTAFYVSGSKLTGFGLLEHDQSEPLALARRAVDLYRSAAPASLELADALDLVGYNLTYTPFNDEAFAPLRESLELREELVGPMHTSLVRTLEHLSDAYISAGQFDEALPHILRMREIAENAYPPEAPMHFAGAGQYATFLSETGQLEEAVEAWKAIIHRKNTASGNYYDLIGYQYLVGALIELGRLDEATGYLNQAAEITRASEVEWGLARVYFGYATIAMLKNQEDETLRFLGMAVELATDDYRLETLPLYAPLYQDARFQALVQQHKTTVAEGTALSAAEHNRKYYGNEHTLGED